MQTVRPARRYAAAGVICLVLAAFFWGTTFVAQIFGAGTVGPFTYVFSRSVFSVVCRCIQNCSGVFAMDLEAICTLSRIP